MNTNQLNYACSHDPFIRKSFGGVFPSDALGKPTKKCYIINLDTSNNPGSHWVAVYFGKEPFYFDSFAFPPTLNSIKRFLGKKYKYNKKKMQSIYSLSCGHFCLYFLYHKSRNLPIPFISDRGVVKFIESHFKIIKPRFSGQCCKRHGRHNLGKLSVSLYNRDNRFIH